MTLIQEIRKQIIRKIIDKSKFRKKVLRVEKIYFNESIDGISAFEEMPINSNGSIIPFVGLNGKTLMRILKSIESGEIYGYIDYKGSKCKIRPKKIVK